MKPNKKTKLRWIAKALRSLMIEGEVYSCLAFYYSEKMRSEEWYAIATCKIMGRNANFLNSADFGGTYSDISLERRLQWILWLREMVRNNEL